jgi:hypothetical protein
MSSYDGTQIPALAYASFFIAFAICLAIYWLQFRRPTETTNEQPADRVFTMRDAVLDGGWLAVVPNGPQFANCTLRNVFIQVDGRVIEPAFLRCTLEGCTLTGAAPTSRAFDSCTIS